MSFLFRWILLLACVLGLSGCWPAAQGPLDEQKESNFLTGKTRAQDRDFDGAVEAFEKALEVNPHSASAHFELAVIYQQQKSDFAAALYHYEKSRRLRPNAYPADLAGQQLEYCKRELAKTVTQTPTGEYLQRELDRLTLENQQLKQLLSAWQNYYHGRTAVMPAVTNLVPPPTGTAPQNTPAPLPVRTNNRTGTLPENPVVRAPQPAPRPVAPAATRTCKVEQGDTLSRIASKHGVKLPALRAANPGLDERRMRVGQTLVLPAP